MADKYIKHSYSSVITTKDGDTFTVPFDATLNFFRDKNVVFKDGNKKVLLVGSNITKIEVTETATETDKPQDTLCQ